jgi:2-phosphosulfolactate phosphatase
VAVRRSAGAARVYTAALLNGEAVVQEVERTLSGETVLLVCAGSADSLSLEDFYAAGYLASLFARRNGAHDLSDAALAARMLHDGRDAFDCLSQGRIGRLMLSRGLEQEVRFAARKDRFTVVPRLESGRLVAG